MEKNFLNGVILNAYPDSIGGRLSEIVSMLQKPQFNNAFSLFYILPTFFKSDLDRGFSIIDYSINEELVSKDDLAKLKELDIRLKFDLVLNHLSVASPQFKDILQHGDGSEYKDFFIDWNEFWQDHGRMTPDGFLLPEKEYLEKLFMRKPGLPILKVRFPDDSHRFYWNTFYQKVTPLEITGSELTTIEGITDCEANQIALVVNHSLRDDIELDRIDFKQFHAYRDDVISIVERKFQYLGQMDLNAESEKVWEFYDETLKKVHAYGAKIIRLDAFAYLHKQPGKVNFFNKPGTFKYLDRLNKIAERYDLTLLPEIHSQYGSGIHNELAEKGFLIYDFFFPGLVIDALDRGINKHLLGWIREVIAKGIKTVNMLGSHDGIPVLDLRGKNGNNRAEKGLLADEKIDLVIENIMGRGGIVKNLYGPDGKKISYYQVNATFFSALGENEQKLRLARAIQLFMPGIAQVWYLDLFAGKNNYKAANNGDACCHKEINRTNLSLADIEKGLEQAVVLDQLEMIRLRNTSPAFNGKLEIGDTDENELHLTWKNGNTTASLQADLHNYRFRITDTNGSGNKNIMSFE
ncbi:MAG: alpha-amylase family glycosyl hydrolase [Desulfobacteraceae bacterium]|jgi:sucrose phosphorylase